MSPASKANTPLTSQHKGASKPYLEKPCLKHEECKKAVKKGGEIDLVLQDHPLYHYCQNLSHALYKLSSRPTKDLLLEVFLPLPS